MWRALRRHGTIDQGTPGRAAGRGRRLARWAAPAIASVAVAGCASATASPGGHTPVQGGVVTYALNPATVPKYIFPFAGSAYFSVVNTDNLDYLLYRPLYWYGEGTQPYLNEQLSLAHLPTFQGNVVTIKLKHYKWSNGEQVTAQDVVFWMHMMQVEAPYPNYNWGGYVPGGLPDNVKSVRAVTPTEVQLVLKTSTFSHTWFEYNELSQITPMPLAWDVTARGKSDCATRISDCAAVYQYLNSKAKNPPSWPGSPLWSVVDGPWKLTGYDSQGVLTFRFNPAYSGTVRKDHITEFKEIPFTSEEAEYNVLQAQGRNTLDVGYLPTVDASLPAPGQAVGQNPVSGYQLQALYAWALSYFPYNFGPMNPLAAVYKQLYFRTAFQDLMNQELIIQGPLHGYGKLTTGVVGDFPRTKYLSKQAKQGDPFPFNLVAAGHLLQNNGWNVQPGGTTTCVHAALCGKGVAAGTKLDFTIDYASGLAWLEAELLQLKSYASELGINITLKGMNFQDVINMAAGNCGPSGRGPCRWAMADWGLGWSYVPDYLPTGDELFQSHAVANFGQFENKHNDALITATLKSSDPSLMWRWEDYLTSRLPVVLQPNAPYQLVESINNLRIGMQPATLAINPEDWYYVR